MFLNLSVDLFGCHICTFESIHELHHFNNAKSSLPRFKSDYVIFTNFPFKKNFSSCLSFLLNMPPKIHRKKPFSGKQKKQQLHDKNAKKAEKGL